MADGEQRFNPPPGWPPAPAGWRPAPGWTPPADWPPVPPGWQLWLPATPPAVAPTPPAVAPTRPAIVPAPPPAVAPVRHGGLPWYRTTWGTLLLLVLFFPVGLFLMWRRQSWGRGVKWALTAATAVFVAIALASGGSSPSSSVADHVATPSTPISSSAPPVTSAAVPAVSSPVITAVPPATHSTVAPPVTTKAPVIAPAPSTPRTSRPAPIVASTTAPPPIQHTSAPAATCYPLTNGGNCYEPGEFCRKSDHGAYGIAGNGERIVCAYNNGWRWEPV